MLGAHREEAVNIPIPVLGGATLAKNRKHAG